MDDRRPTSTQIPCYWETRQDYCRRQRLAEQAIDHDRRNGKVKSTTLQCAWNPFSALRVMDSDTSVQSHGSRIRSTMRDFFWAKCYATTWACDIARMELAFAMSSEVPCTNNTYLSTFNALSYLMTWLLVMPISLNAAPKADTPPTNTAPSTPPTSVATIGPAMASKPMPGMRKTAGASKSPQIPPQNAPVFPHALMRSPLV